MGPLTAVHSGTGSALGTGVLLHSGTGHVLGDSVPHFSQALPSTGSPRALSLLDTDPGHCVQRGTVVDARPAQHARDDVRQQTLVRSSSEYEPAVLLGGQSAISWTGAGPGAHPPPSKRFGLQACGQQLSCCSLALGALPSHIRLHC
eukprot:1476035-Prymnesium_polylepis.2